MLKPFRVKGLNGDSPPTTDDINDRTAKNVPVAPLSLVANDGTVKSRTPRSGVVHLSAPQYDEIVTTHPKAALTYMDEDDGEVIAVGSSFELAQRLDEPLDIPSLFHCRFRTTSPGDDTTPMHVFDIRRSSSVTELWKPFERRRSMESLGQTSPRSPVYSSRPLTSRPSMIQLDDEKEAMPKPAEAPNSVFETRSNETRERWFQACNPPQLPPKGTALSEACNIVDGLTSVNTETQDPLSSFEDSPRLKEESASRSPLFASESITAEGRRQAQEAGARLGAARIAKAGSNASFMSDLPQPGNSWASYRLRHAFNNKPSGAPSPDTTAKPSQNKEDEPQPLLSAFEAEMAKMTEPSESASRVEPSPSEPTSMNEDASTENKEPSVEKPVTLPTPAKIITHALQNLAGGVELLGTELKSKMPEFERRLTNAQKAIPEQLGPAIQTTFTTLDSEVKNLGNVLQDASIATGQAANRVRQAGLGPAEQVLEGLGKIVGDVTQIGRTFFTAFETELERQSSCAQHDATSAKAQMEKPQANTASRNDAIEKSVSPDSPNDLPVTATKGSEISTDSLSPSTNHATKGATTSPHHSHRPIPRSKPQESKPAQASSQVPQVLHHPSMQDSSFRVPPPPPPHWVHPALPSCGWRSVPPAFAQTHPPSWTKPHFSFESPNAVPPPPLPPMAPVPSMTSFHRHPPPPPRFYAQEPPPLPSDSTFQSPARMTSFNNAAPSIQNRPGFKTTGSSKDTLFIGNIGFGVTEQTLRDVFASHGFLADISLPRASATGKHAGFGYAKFPSVPAARAALDALQGAHVDGLAINLEFSDTSPPKLPQASNAISEASSQHSTAPDSFAHAPPGFRLIRQRQSWHPTSERSEPKRVSFTGGIAPGDSPLLPIRKGNRAPVHDNGNGNVHKAHIAPINEIHDCDTDKRLDLSSPNPGQENSAGTSAANQEGNNEPRDRALLDVEVDEMPKFSARYPSLLPGEDFTWPSTTKDSSPVTATSDRLRALSPDVEMAQFPPVSQLEARLLASQPLTARELHELSSARSETKVGTESVSSNLDRSRQRHSNPMTPSAAMARLTRPFDPHIPHQPLTVDRGLRRSVTERAPCYNRTHGPPFPPRPLRLTKREPDFSVPGSFPADDLSQTRESHFSTARPDHITRSPFIPPQGPSDRDAQMAVRRSEVDNCVETLSGLGYGTEKDGGRQRLAVYAEAVDGKVSDAIEMIEEDRKASAQHAESYF